MKRVSKFSATAIFDEYMRLENRIPSKAEWEMEFYGRMCKRNENNYYYQVKKRWLENNPEVSL